MYVPPVNAVDDPAAIVHLLRTAAIGHLVSADRVGALDATVLPFLVDDDLGALRAHIARANPQWRHLDGAEAMMIVPVVDAYVSPSWYETKQHNPRVVPTWNYEVVHVHGTVRVRDEPGFVESIVRSLTDLHEARRIASAITPQAWDVDDAPVEFIDRQLRAIVGVELSVSRIEAKRKLSQNRSELDRRGVIEGLSSAADRRSMGVADAMRDGLAGG
jgi:transcriptional regulator